MVLPILPLYATREFGMSERSVTLLNTAFFAAQFIAGPFIGRLSDRYGRIPVLIVSQVGTVIAFLMLGFANAVWLLFFARILDGVTGGNIIVAQAYITDITPREQRTTALGYVFLVFGIGFIFGPALGGILATTFSYHTPYLVAAGAASIVVMMTWLMLEETVSAEQREANRSKTGGQMTVQTVISNVPLLVILGVTFGAQFGFAMLQSTFALLGRDVIFSANPDRAELGVGLLLAMFGVGQIFTQGYLIKRLIDRFGESPLVLVGTIARGISMFILAIIAVPFSAGVSFIFFAIGTGIQMPALQSIVTNTVPDNQRGGVLGLYQSAISLSIIVGSAISGSLYTISPYTPYYVGGGLFALMIIPSYFLMRWGKRQERARAAEELALTAASAGGD